MSGVKDAEDVAGKLLGKDQCRDCGQWFHEEDLTDYGANIVYYVCQECKDEYEAYKRVTS